MVMQTVRCSLSRIESTGNWAGHDLVMKDSSGSMAISYPSARGGASQVQFTAITRADRPDAPLAAVEVLYVDQLEPFHL